ncbi:MAG: response regulator transcription factor [Anaerolineae bacterium]|nr:response regulator transcription factor [Anaerolineae bacterium]
MKRYCILFVERHHALEASVLPALRQTYDVAVVHGRREAMTALETSDIDLALIDVPSIRFDLARFCGDLKARRPLVLWFFLLGKGMRLDQLPRANGYIRHPFTMRRLQNRLSRALPERQGEVVTWRDLRLHTATNSLAWGAEEAYLTPKQAALARQFLEAPETIVSRVFLMQAVWGTDYMGDTRTLDVHVHWLRKALALLKAPYCLETVRGAGYRLLPDTPEGGA